MRGKRARTASSSPHYERVVWVERKTARGAKIMLGSNDPNTISDPTRIQCSRFCIVLMFPLGLRFCFGLGYDLCSLRTPYFPVTFSRDFVDICFMFPFHYSLCFPRVHYVFSFTFSDSTVSPQPYLIVLCLHYSDLVLVSRSGVSAC